MSMHLSRQGHESRLRPHPISVVLRKKVESLIDHSFGSQKPSFNHFVPENPRVQLLTFWVNYFASAFIFFVEAITFIFITRRQKSEKTSSHSCSSSGVSLTGFDCFFSFSASSFNRFAESSLGIRGGSSLLASSASQLNPSNHLWSLISFARPLSTPKRRAGRLSNNLDIKS